jgi:hypothetical protein
MMEQCQDRRQQDYESIVDVVVAAVAAATNETQKPMAAE